MNSKTQKVENSSDGKLKSKVTRYDFTEFARQLDIIQKRNKMAKRAIFRLNVSKSEIKEIKSETTVEESHDDDKPIPKQLALEPVIKEEPSDG